MPDNVIEVRYHDKYLKWRDGLTDVRAKALINAREYRIEKDGFFGDQRLLGGGVWEIRVGYGPGYRLYYTRQGAAVILLLCGGDKSSQTEDINLAKQLAKEV
jgi:putative addiction module killer protein